MAVREVTGRTGYFADAAVSMTKRTKVHVVGVGDRPLCGAKVRGLFHFCGHSGRYVECRRCKAIYARQEGA